MAVCGIKVSEKNSLFEIEKKLFFLKCNILVVFRMVVFRPFTSEVIIAKVKSSDEDGIRRAFLYKNSFICQSSNEPNFF